MPTTRKKPSVTKKAGSTSSVASTAASRKSSSRPRKQPSTSAPDVGNDQPVSKKRRLESGSVHNPELPDTEYKLPQQVPPRDRQQRSDAIAENRKIYEWATYEDWAPPHVKGLPKPEAARSQAKHKVQQTIDFVGSWVFLGSRAIADSLEEKLSNITDRMVPFFPDANPRAPFDRYDDIYTKNRTPKTAYRWRDDAEWARQRFQGLLPVYIKKFTEVPAKFPVTDEMLKPVFPDGETIASMIKQDRLWWVDYEFLSGVPVDMANADRNMCAPMALFFLTGEGNKEPMPAAIQLGQVPGPQYPIFTPVGEDVQSNRWLVAKLLFNSSEGCLHEARHHLLATHLAMEVVYVAMKRTMYVHHPLHEILEAHFFYTLNINDAARKLMLAPPVNAVPNIMSMGTDGIVPLLKKSWEQFSMNEYDLEKCFAERKVTKLPDYYFRDDSLRVWGSINDYVRDVFSYFYGNSDEAVQEDSELQAFVKELHTQGRFADKDTPFVGDKATTLEQVIDFCTKVIWACSGYHASLNNGQFDYYGCIPNAPGVLRIPAPTKNERFDLSEIASALPSRFMTLFQMSFIHSLTVPTDQKLAHFTHDRDYMKKCDKVQKEFLPKWREDLTSISQSIQARNEKLGPVKQYIYLDPVQIASGIAI